MNEQTGWFADIDPDQPKPYQWQPCLEMRTGHIPCFEVFFRSREDYEAWIREILPPAGKIRPSQDDKDRGAAE